MRDPLPPAIANRLISMHMRYRQRKDAGPANGRTGPHAATNQPEVVKGYTRPSNAPLLNLPLNNYPTVQTSLAKLEIDNPRKDFLRFSDPLITGIGCDTIGELLELIYSDLTNRKYGGSTTDALEDYIKKSIGSNPPRRLIMIMMAAFEADACTFEDEDFGF
jgi:hypothetical protein